MDTNNSEFQKALNDLYIAVVRVMSLSNPNNLTDEMKRNELVAQLANWTSLLRGGTYREVNSTPSSQPLSVDPSQSQVKQVQVRYATAPEEDEGNFYFKRTIELNLQDPNNKDDSRYFAISIYDDGTCTYEMKEDVRGDKLQILVDNKDTMLCDRVVKYSGTPSANSKIVTVAVGKGVKRGKSIQIVEPLEIKFE